MTTDESLTVLVGAGASFDCVDMETCELDPGHRPPLVDQIFEPRATFNAVLNRYNGARGLSDAIRLEIVAGKRLEEVLRKFTAANSPVRRAAMEIPLYLAEMFGQVGTQYVRTGGTRFQTMLVKLLYSRFRRILLLTVNYDRFLENAVATVGGHTIASMDSFVWDLNGRSWGLVKLHGSVNWGRRMILPGVTPGSWEVALENVTNALEVDEQDFRFLAGHAPEQRVGADGYYYPALSVPITEKTDFVCPETHLEYADRVVAGSTHVLVAGFSGNDAHVIRRFVPRLERPVALKVVNGNRELGLAGFRALANENPRILELGEDDCVFDGGFADFVGKGFLDSFLGIA